MQITCPSCEAEYTVPDAKIAGREVKCSRCGTQWTPVPRPLPLPPLVQQPPALPPPPQQGAVPTAAQSWAPASPSAPLPSTRSAEPARQAAAPKPRLAFGRDPALLAAWAASLLLLAVACAGAYAGRDGIMHAWPPSQRLYAALGLR